MKPKRALSPAVGAFCGDRDRHLEDYLTDTRRLAAHAHPYAQSDHAHPYARSDHAHTPAGAVVAEQGFGQAPDVGSSPDYARGDHTHGTPTDAEPWTGAALPTTNLRLGRLIYASNLTNNLFGPDSGKRQYIYREAPIGLSGPAWRLASPIIYTVTLGNDFTTTATSVDIFAAGFGAAPCPVDATVVLEGESTSTGVLRGDARISRTATGSVVALSIARIGRRPQLASPLYMAVAFHEARAAGGDIAYGMQAYSDGTCTWMGTGDAPWKITITLT